MRIRTRTKCVTLILLCLCLLLYNIVQFRLRSYNMEEARSTMKPELATTHGHSATQQLRTQPLGTQPLPTQPAANLLTNAVDMTNSYHPFVDFKFVFPGIEHDLRKDVDMFLVVLVNSGASGDTYAKRRDKIRHTWASHKSCDQSVLLTNPALSKLQWSVAFVLGKGARAEDERRNEKEAAIHKDMLVGDIPDNYLNNVVKLYMALLWVSTSTSAKYILKTDDDVFVRVPRVIQHIARKSFPGRYYGGFTYTERQSRQINRNPNGKWAISRKYFNEDIFPPFNPGAFIVLSRDLLPRLFRYTAMRKPFHTDDAYVGVAMRDMNVTAKRIGGFFIVQHAVVTDNYMRFFEKKSDCEIWEYVAIGHDIQPTTVEYLYNRFEQLCRRNVSASCTQT